VKIRPTIAMLFLAGLTFLVLGVVPPAGAQGNAGKQKICHRTGSSNNPYVVIGPSKNAAGHSTHPDKGGNNNKNVPNSAQKGPTFKSGYNGCSTSNGGGGGGGGSDTPSNGGGAGFAAPAGAIVEEPSVTG
jgi:hypothetical protein